MGTGSGWLALPIGLALGSAAALPAGYHHHVPASGAVPGLRVGGQTLAPGAAVAEHVEAAAREVHRREVALVTGQGEPLRVRLADLGVRVDVEGVSRRAEAIGRRGGWAVRLTQLYRAHRSGIDVPLAYDIDAERAHRHLRPIKDALDSTPVSARLDLDADRVVPHVAGRYVHVDATIGRILAAAASGEREVQVAVTEVVPAVDADLAASIDRSSVVAKFETHFGRGGRSAGRARNIETAAAKLDGIVLAPGDVVSFNHLVGARTIANGFDYAPEIYKGEMRRGVGGGTCQVASTLHAAAFFGGFDVVERYPHSRPSGYIALGLDATVSWPTVDLKLKNPWDFPVVVDTEVEGNRIEVRLLGSSRPAEVSYHSDTIGIIPFKRKVTESNWLEPGRVIKKQKGIRGYRIRRHRRIVEGGQERVETTVDRYPATPEHFIIGPGTNPDEDLPPLPEGAAETAETT